ncbi:ABC transporter ATP-binding protein [Methanoculleus sp. 7T]|jgi:putative ABC transport system ATP-binding protein|uniref:ABC transporter ATP-binding protein n=1 Tax=Methanoculleus sp. 7T TaxID=2937282 RepID=UPI0020C14FB3|nr:ABC transporter ATP-binding protein [Methanoculleus sp. 7T]MCK8519104.1 ABC transporter ATP-binding protein [Methanoculleus sp. 7T]
MSGEPVVRFEDVTKVYSLPAGAVVALDHVSLTVEPGEFIAVMGPSGSGKSTLLNLMGCLDVPTTGKVYLSGQDISTLSDDDLTRLRRDHIGFIFQQFNLIPLLSAVENVEFPVVLTTGREESRRRATEVLRAMHLDDALFSHRPGELSGGEQQRVAIARALVNDPDLLLCDEPTGNLDTKTGTAIMDILAAENRRGKTIVMVTHDPRVAGYARRRIQIVDGRLV